jgi:hypothetical protein
MKSLVLALCDENFVNAEPASAMMNMAGKRNFFMTEVLDEVNGCGIKTLETSCGIPLI